MTPKERLKLEYLSENCKLAIKGADKSGKIAIIDKADHIEHCKLLLYDREFYDKLDANPTLSYTEEVKQNIENTLKITA